MKVKNLLACLLALIFMIIPASAEDGDNLIQPYAMSISFGYLYDATHFEQSYYLDYRNGNFIFFDVENLGTTEVVCSINGAGTRTISPGDSATLWYPVLNPFIEEYKFQILPRAYRGTISVHYSITQRDNS